MRFYTFSKILAVALVLLLAPGAGAKDLAAQPAQAGSPAVEADAQETPQLLTGEEAADLSQRAEEPGKEVAGGALSNLHLTYIVIALAAAVIVLVAK
jgi:hypothetical protein